MERAVVDCGRWFRRETPIHWASHVVVPVFGYEDVRLQIRIAGFQKEDVMIQLLRQAPRNHGARRPGTDDDVVIAGSEILLTGRLVGCDCQDLIRDLPTDVSSRSFGCT